MEQNISRLHLSDEIRRFGERWNLTPRERDVLNLIALGTTRIKDVAGQLNLSPNTVNNHVNSIFAKTQTRSKSELLTRLLMDLTDELLRHRMHQKCPRIVAMAGAAVNDEMRAFFETKSCRVAAINTVNELILALNSEPTQFLVVDADLPGLNVEEILERLNSAPFIWTKVIILAQNKPTPDCAMFMDRGAIEVSSKPTNLDRLYMRMMAHYTESVESLVQFEADFLNLQTKGRAVVDLTPDRAGRGGLFLRSDELSRSIHSPVGVGDRLDLELRLQTGAPSIQAHGQIVWLRENADSRFPAGAGVRLVTVNRDDRDRWVRFHRDHGLKSFIPLGSGVVSGK